MAATISQLHFSQQEIEIQEIEQSSPPSPPKSIGSSSSLSSVSSSLSSSSSTSSSSSSSFLHGEQLPHSPEHYCRDCEVMFESSTSLEVHLSYHKENLLTRWATQSQSQDSEKSVVSNPSTSPHSNNNSSSSLSLSEPNSMSDMSTSGSSGNSHPPTPHSLDGNNTTSSGSGGGASQRFFPSSGGAGSSEQHLGQFSNSQYGSNPSSNEDQQHSLDQAYRQQQQGMSNNNFGQPQQQPPQPPVDLNSHANGNMAHHSPYHSPIMIAQNNIFSPNNAGIPPPPTSNHHSQQPPPPQSGGEQHNRAPPPPQNTEQGTAAAIRESAEILDLDSQKVHVYQHPVHSSAPFFHSPYGLPPFFGNGWGHAAPPEHHYGHVPPPPPHGFNEHHAISPYPPQAPPGHLPPHAHPPPPHHQQPPPPNHHQNHPPPSSVYDIDRPNPSQFSADPPGMEYPPQSQIQPQPPQNQPPTSIQSQPPPPPFGQPNGLGFPSLAPQPAEIRQERISLSSPLAPSPAQKSPNEGSTPAGNTAAAAAAKTTKGWKGGECKRPKTYNCTACNKWFTSSGHLKRHYGTTLHKNSIKQKDLPEDPPPPAKRGKNGINKAAAAAAAAAAANNNNATDLIRDRSPMKDFGLKGSDVSNGRSGYLPSPPIIQNSPAPPKISPQRHLDHDMDKGLHSKPPGHMIGSSPAFNIPAGFKSYESQALNAESNSSIDHHAHNPGYLVHPPTQQRLFNPGMPPHHQHFYPMSHAPPSFLNGFAPESLQNGPPPPSSQYVG